MTRPRGWKGKDRRVERLDRQSATGVSGLPKKGGFKGWGRIADEIEIFEELLEEEEKMMEEEKKMMEENETMEKEKEMKSPTSQQPSEDSWSVVDQSSWESFPASDAPAWR